MNGDQTCRFYRHLRMAEKSKVLQLIITFDPRDPSVLIWEMRRLNDEVVNQNS